MSAKGRPRKLRVTTEAEYGERIMAKAWRYRRTKSSTLEMYVHVKDTAGNWATLRIMVPR